MENEFNMKSIEELNLDETNDITGGNSVFLVGSVISYYHPTDIPAGGNVAKATYEYIFQNYHHEKWQWLRDQLKELPFEALNECHPDKNKLKLSLKNLFSNSEYNRLHKLIAQQVIDSKISALITTNYDLTFDALFSQYNHIRKLYSSSSCNRFNEDTNASSHNTYFKIHGCVSDEDSMIFTLEQEKRLDLEKVRALKKILDGKNLVVIGYSGRDFDICSLIANQKAYGYKKIYWLKYPKDDLSPYAKLLLDKCGNFLLIEGDLQHFLNKCFRTSINEKYGNGQFEPNLTYSLSDKELAQWRIKILNRISCATLGMVELEKCKQIFDYDYYLEMKWDLYGHTGEYYKAVKTSKQLLKIYKKGTIEYHTTLGTISGHYLSYTDFFSSLYYLYSCIIHLNLLRRNGYDTKTLEVDIKFRILVFVAYVYRNLPFPLSIPFKIVGQNSLKDFEKDDLFATASWHQKQGIRFLAERLDLKGVNFSQESEEILDSINGFKNLGIPADEILSYREGLESSKKAFDKDEFDLYVSKAIRLGKYPEVWKLYRIRAIKHDNDSDNRNESLRQWRQYLSMTEYGILGTIYTRYSLFKFHIKTKAKQLTSVLRQAG